MEYHIWRSFWIEENDAFIWSVWVSISKQNFMRTIELLEVKGRESEEPYVVWLSTELQNYPSTLSLKTEIYTREVGLCPIVVLEPTASTFHRPEYWN